MAGPIPEVRILFYPYAQQAYMGTGYTALSLPRTGRSGEGGNGEKDQRGPADDGLRVEKNHIVRACGRERCEALSVSGNGHARFRILLVCGKTVYPGYSRKYSPHL